MSYYYEPARNPGTKMAQVQEKLIAFDSHKAQAIDYLGRLQDYLKSGAPIPAQQRAFDATFSKIKARHTLMWKLHAERMDDLGKVERLLISSQKEYFQLLREGKRPKAVLTVNAAFARARHLYSQMEYDLDVGKPGGVKGRKAEMPQTSAEYEESIPCAQCGHPLPPSAIKRRSKRCITCYRKDRRMREDLAQGWTVTVTDKKRRLQSFKLSATKRADAVEKALRVLVDDLPSVDRRDAKKSLTDKRPAWASSDGRYIITTARVS